MVSISTFITQKYKKFLLGYHIKDVDSFGYHIEHVDSLLAFMANIALMINTLPSPAWWN